MQSFAYFFIFFFIAYCHYANLAVNYFLAVPIRQTLNHKVVMARITAQFNISLKQLSAEAGVTPSTASRILNNRPGYSFSDETVRKVMAVAKRSGYRPNQLYRSVFTGATMSVGLIINMDDFNDAIARGAHDQLLENNYATLLGLNQIDFDRPDDSQEIKIIHRLLEHRVDGFIIRPTLDNADNQHFQEIINRELPLIAVDRRVKAPYADYVGSDDDAGGRLAAAYLTDLGHHNIVQFPGNLACSSLRDRAAGFEAEILKRGGTLQTLLMQCDEEVTAKAGIVFSRPQLPTAVFCGNDMIASLIYDILAERRLRVPEDVSVLGYGNQGLSNFLRPRLTTIDQQPYQLGRQAAAMLLRRIADNQAPYTHGQTYLAPVKLLERDSCRALK